MESVHRRNHHDPLMFAAGLMSFEEQCTIKRIAMNPTGPTVGVKERHLVDLHSTEKCTIAEAYCATSLWTIAISKEIIMLAERSKQ
ncbi:hypothetical protein NDU88_005600 [Pleurodeles waltl]|uniref:Uncharacterized protein n=1 Tax=Pleurodeles waltl TaxID=8319 RepID=A0AAV7NR29_PLEWA|nr:hypothetical protein NDU88_005600 [Pleurodeles waltl]